MGNFFFFERDPAIAIVGTLIDSETEYNDETSALGWDNDNRDDEYGTYNL